jgi:hypothetical protein
MGRVRSLFDPKALFNPDKIFPSGAVCGEVRARQQAAGAGAWL